MPVNRRRSHSLGPQNAGEPENPSAFPFATITGQSRSCGHRPRVFVVPQVPARPQPCPPAPHCAPNTYCRQHVLRADQMIWSFSHPCRRPPAPGCRFWPGRRLIASLPRGTVRIEVKRLNSTFVPRELSRPIARILYLHGPRTAWRKPKPSAAHPHHAVLAAVHGRPTRQNSAAVACECARKKSSPIFSATSLDSHLGGEAPEFRPIAPTSTTTAKGPMGTLLGPPFPRVAGRR